jgi:quercetin 2,3-dioxygenase
MFRKQFWKYLICLQQNNGKTDQKISITNLLLHDFAAEICIIKLYKIYYMISIHRSDKSQKIRRGLFNIDLNLPGVGLNNPNDERGLAQLGRFDFAHLYPGVFVGMHLHKNDEILTYIRAGEMIHEDSTGSKVTINNKKIMMMNAGSGFQHQESIAEGGEEVRLLQIFMRPENEDDKPSVSFYDFDSAYSINDWRLVAGYDKEKSPLVVKTKANVWDTRLERENITLPNMKGKTYLLFVFKNTVTLNDGNVLLEGDSLIYNNEELSVTTENYADLVLFELDESATYIRNGMYSGI